jgi:hypothetical protein
MRAKSRLFTAFLAIAMLTTLLPAAAAAAEFVPGRPGRYELSSITIDATSGDCKATYETPAAGNLWMRGVDASVRVLTNPNWVHVTCRFTDMSARIELNAEVGYTDACTVVTESATYTDGWGIATSAANVGERAEGGNSMAMCRFRVEPTRAVARPPVAAKAKPAAGPDGTEGIRRRGESATAKGSSATEPARDARPAKRTTTRRTSSGDDKPSTTASHPSMKRDKAGKADDHPKRDPQAGKRGRGR